MLVETNEAPGRSDPAPEAAASGRQDRAPAAGALAFAGGLAVFVGALALYAVTMPHSFVPGDSANYLNLAHTGSLTDRGNGVPLYITLLNAIVRVPFPAALDDGIRANLLTVLLAAGGLALAYAAAFRMTRSVLAAAIASAGLTLCGLVWTSSSWIMPHVGMLGLGALFVLVLVEYDRAPSGKRAAAMGLLCGIGFGLLPDALLYAPVAIGFALLRLRGRLALEHVAIAAAGLAAGVAFNAALIAWHETWNPTLAIDGRSVLASTLFYVSGGQETDWLLGNLTVGLALRGFLTLPLEIGADLEFAGSALALFGMINGLRTRPVLHVGLVASFAIISMWSGVYPGDTRLLHGLGAYPIAGIWLAMGAHAVLRAVDARARSFPWCAHRPHLRALGLGVVLGAVLVANLAAGKVFYRDALCSTGQWFLAGFCRERIPESVGDLHLRRARAAIEQIPEGALVIGAAWDATDQMKYLIEVRRERADLGRAHDLTKLDPEEFLRLAEPAWASGRRVFLFGEWHDIELWSPVHMRHFEATPHGELVFELFALRRAPEPGGIEDAP
jgi:hypothetical protein